MKTFITLLAVSGWIILGASLGVAYCWYKLETTSFFLGH